MVKIFTDVSCSMTQVLNRDSHCSLLIVNVIESEPSDPP